MTNQTQIPGVPVGCKVVRIGDLERGCSFLSNNGQIEKSDGKTSHCPSFVIVEPDNPYNKFLHEVEADIKAVGRERLGGDDYRNPKQDEEFWGIYPCEGANKAVAIVYGNHERLILKPLKPKTRKVLVVECEAPEDIKDIIGRLKSIRFEWMDGFGQPVKDTATYRIEERPL